MTTGFDIIRFDELIAQPWKNGAGTTREIARDGSGDAWDWRISIADVVATAPFSEFPGIDRILVLLEGEGIALDFDDGRRIVLSPPFGSARFEGEAALTGRPTDGATRDFNLMWRRSHLAADFDVRPVVGSWVLCQAPQETWIVHVAAGSLTLTDAGASLGRGDTLCVRGGERSKLRMEGAGTVFVARLRPVDDHVAS